MDFEEEQYRWWTGEKQEFEDGLAMSYARHEGNPDYWKTKSGDYILVSELETRHLINIAKLLVRVAKAEASDVDIPDDVSAEMAFQRSYRECLIWQDNYSAINRELNNRNITALPSWVYNADKR